MTALFQHVTVLQFPISDRYCHIGYVATLDITNNKIRCGGSWFYFDNRWVIEK